MNKQRIAEVKSTTHDVVHGWTKPVVVVVVVFPRWRCSQRETTALGTPPAGASGGAPTTDCEENVGSGFPVPGGRSGGLDTFFDRISDDLSENHVLVIRKQTAEPC